MFHAAVMQDVTMMMTIAVTAELVAPEVNLAQDTDFFKRFLIWVTVFLYSL